MTLFRRIASLLIPGFAVVLLAFAVGVYWFWSQHLSMQLEIPRDLLLQQKEKILGIVVMTTTFLFALLLSVTWWVYYKLSRPLYHLEAEALRLSGGDYVSPIQVDGFREIQSLANSYNVLQASLEELSTRIHESKVARELLYGEQECAFFLQHYMLDDVIDRFSSDRLEMRSVSVHFGTRPWGLFLEASEEHDVVSLRLKEAAVAGFQGIYQLLYQSQADVRENNDLTVELSFSNQEVLVQGEQMPAPLFWSAQEKEFVEVNSSHSYRSGDYLFVYNRGLADMMERGELVPNWFDKVLRHFSEDGVGEVATMLQRELQYIARSSSATHDLHLLCLRFI